MNVDLMPEKAELAAFVARAKRIYAERYQEEFEKLYRDKYVALEPESGDYFLGDTKLDAAISAKAKYPERTFHFILIGHKGVYKRR